MKKIFFLSIFCMVFGFATELTFEQGFEDGYVDGNNLYLKNNKEKVKKQTESKAYNDGYSKGFSEGFDRDKNNLRVRLGVDGCDLLRASPSYLVDSQCQLKKLPFSWKLIFSGAGGAKTVQNISSNSLYSLSNTSINYYTNLSTSVNFGAYYRVWNHLLIGGNAGIGTGVVLEAFKDDNATTSIYGIPVSAGGQKLQVKGNFYIPIEVLVKYYFSWANASVGGGLGVDVSFIGYHTFKTFLEAGWPGFTMRLGFQTQGGLNSANQVSRTAIYSAIVFGY